MKPLKVQFGCGGNRLPDFENHDQEVDIRKNLPYGDNSVDFVLAEHVAEHITGPEVLHFFEEVYRILKPGGAFRLCIPVLERLNMSERRDIISHHGHLTIWTTDLIPYVLWATANWKVVCAVAFDPTIDGHWKIIGQEKDTKETARFEAVK